MGNERRAGVHKHTRKNRHKGKRQHIDTETEIAVYHHQRHKYGEDGDQQIEHGYAARLLEIVFAEHRQIDGEEQHKREHIDRAAGQMLRQLALRGVAALQLALERIEHPIVVLIDHIAHADDFLPCHHHAAGRRYATQQIVARGLGVGTVID